MQQIQKSDLEREGLVQPIITAPLGDSRVRLGSEMSERKICLFGLFGMDNYGNDGSLEAMLAFLRENWPRALLSCVCIDPAKVERTHKVPSIPMSWRGPSSQPLRLLNKLALTLPQKLGNWLLAVRHLRKFDVLIVPGTSPLCDYRAGSFGAPYAIFRWTAAARLAGKRIFLVSVGAGPIQGKLSRWMLTYVAGAASYRSFRDQNSKDFIGSLGIDIKDDVVYPDLAFKLPVPLSQPSNNREFEPTTVAVGLIDYNGWHGHARPDDSIYETYLAKMTSFVSALLGRGYRVRLLVGEIADQRAITGLRTALSTGGTRDRALAQIVVEPVTCLADVMRQIADASVVVASRFHNVVCSLKVGRPTVSVGYQAKNDALMAEFGLSRFCHHIERFDPELLMQQVDELLQNRAAYTDSISNKLAGFHKGIHDQEHALVRALISEQS